MPFSVVATAALANTEKVTTEMKHTKLEQLSAWETTNSNILLP
jgi:hypothetical protein